MGASTAADAPTELAGEGWTARLTCPDIPRQVEGTVDARAFYFRAEYGEWDLSVCDQEGDTEDHRDAAILGDPTHFDLTVTSVKGKYEATDDRGYGGPADTVALLNEAIAKWRETHAVSVAGHEVAGEPEPCYACLEKRARGRNTGLPHTCKESR